METDETTQSILYYIQHVSALASRQSDQVLQEQLGIGLSQFRILQTLRSNPQAQQRHIADLLGQTEASVSRQVKLMQAKGLVATKVNPRNRREHMMAILPKGERLLEAGLQLVAHYHEPALEGLKPKERALLLGLLARLHSKVCVIDGVEGLVHVGSE